MDIVGIDEAGRGPVIGPLVMCGVRMPETRVRELVNLGVKDSKQLLPKRREELYQQLQKIVDGVHLVLIQASEIDAALFGDDFNLNTLEAAKSAEIIKQLSPDRVIIDCPSPNLKAHHQDVKRLLDSLGFEKNNIEIITAHKADVDFPIVSAASIIAKVTRDAIIEDMKKHFKVDFGSGYLTDPKTSIFLEEHWNTPQFATLFRKSWQPWKRIKYDQGQMNLSRF